MSNLSLDGKAWYLHPVGMVLFEKRQCFCDRNLTENEVKKIVEQLRLTEGINSDKLFTSNNCKLSESDKTYKYFTEELNAMMKKYSINSCLRKMHFLAQIYHETARLTTTLEFASGKNDDPGKHVDAIKNGNTTIGDGPKYRGRGIMQLTWKNNYKKYGDANQFNAINHYEMISNNLFYAVDSGGWYWRYGSSWGDLNIRADNDDIYWINVAVNGGFNGFKERVQYVKSLIKFFNIIDCPNIYLNKTLGLYNLDTSAMKSTNYVKNNSRVKSRLESYDE